MPQDTTNDFKLEPQPDDGALDSKYSTTTRTTTGTNNHGNGATQFSITSSDGDHLLLAAKPGTGGGPPDGANPEKLESSQVKTTEDGDTLDCGHDKVAR